MRPKIQRGGRFVVPPRPLPEFPKLLYHKMSGQAFQVTTPEEEAELGEEWGALQPDVKYPARSKPTVWTFDKPKPTPSPVIEVQPVSDFQEYPKAVYHPHTKELVIVEGPEQEAAQLEEWGVDQSPKIPLGEKPVAE